MDEANYLNKTSNDEYESLMAIVSSPNVEDTNYALEESADEE